VLPTAIGTASDLDDRNPNMFVAFRLTQFGVVRLCIIPGDRLPDDTRADLVRRLNVKSIPSLIRLGAMRMNLVTHMAWRCGFIALTMIRQKFVKHRDLFFV
jgi:hypothetical protein